VLLLFALLAITPTASAFLNTKQYDGKTDTVTIRDWLGLSDYLTVKLVDNTDQCLIACSATFELTPAQTMKPKDALEKVAFKDFRDNNVKIKYEVKVNGEDFYKLKELKKGVTYTIELIGHKSPMQKVDWLSTIGGLEINEWAWWNTAWQKKIQLNFTAVGNFPAGYAALVNITYDSDMIADGRDIRFANSAETTELDYWIEEVSNSTYIYTWIELDQAVTAGNNYTAYMYYKNPEVATSSDIEGTMDIGDDFSDTTFNTSKWTKTYFNGSGLMPSCIYTGYTDVYEAGGILKLDVRDNTTTNCILNIFSTETATWNNTYTKMKFNNWTNTTADLYYHMQFGIKNNTNPSSVTVISTGTSAYVEAQSYAVPGSYGAFTGIAYNSTNWISTISIPNISRTQFIGTNWVMVNYTNTTAIAGRANYTRATGYVTNVTRVGSMELIQPSGIQYVFLAMGSNAAPEKYNVSVDIDYMFLTEYVEGTPTIGWGTEVTANLTLNMNSPANATNSTSGIYVLNCTAQATSPAVLYNTTINVWYVNGTSVSSTTNTLPLLTNNSTFTYSTELPTGTNYWNCYAEDNTSTVTTSNRTLIGGRVETPTFNYSDYEGTEQTFTLALNGSLFHTLTNAKLVWNSTSYTPTQTNTSTTATLTFVATLPAVTSTTNVTFYWNYTLNNQNYTTSTYPQQIMYLTPVTGTNSTCGAGLTTTRNYTWANEDTLLSLVNNTIYYDIQYGPSFNTSLKTFNGSTAGTTTFKICINSSQIYYVGYGELHYARSSYFDRRYYIFTNNTFNGSSDTINVTLYHLNASDTPLIVEATTNTLSPYVGYYIALLHWYPAMNSYYIVDMGKTDSEGQTLVHVRESDVDYRIGLYYPNGTLIQLDDPTRITCSAYPCTYPMALSPSLNREYEEMYGIQYSLTNNNATKVVTFIWNDPSGNTQNMTLEVKKMSGAYETTICDTTGAGAIGVLSCNYSAYSGLLTVRAYRTASPSVWMIEMIIDAVTTIFSGGIGIFISFILFLSICLLGIFSPYAAAIMTVVALIPAVVLHSWPMALLGGLALIVIIAMHSVKKVS
jgi:hypothetical protein